MPAPSSNDLDALKRGLLSHMSIFSETRYKHKNNCVYEVCEAKTRLSEHYATSAYTEFVHRANPTAFECFQALQKLPALTIVQFWSFRNRALLVCYLFMEIVLSAPIGFQGVKLGL